MSVFVQTNQAITLPNQAAYAVSETDTGKMFLISIQGAAQTITLPALAAGLHYRFQTPIAGAPITANVGIRAVAANNVSGVLSIVGATPVAITGQTTITFTTANCAIGDFLECYCDGTQWSVFGMSSVAGGLTHA